MFYTIEDNFYNIGSEITSFISEEEMNAYINENYHSRFKLRSSDMDFNKTYSFSGNHITKANEENLYIKRIKEKILI
jgi:hypothetical protein